jgi:hypothetical protein
VVEPCKLAMIHIIVVPLAPQSDASWSGWSWDRIALESPQSFGVIAADVQCARDEMIQRFSDPAACTRLLEDTSVLAHIHNNKLCSAIGWRWGGKAESTALMHQHGVARGPATCAEVDPSARIVIRCGFFRTCVTPAFNEPSVLHILSADVAFAQDSPSLWNAVFLKEHFNDGSGDLLAVSVTDAKGYNSQAALQRLLQSTQQFFCPLCHKAFAELRLAFKHWSSKCLPAAGRSAAGEAIML